jgi:hypothetical protein
MLKIKNINLREELVSSKMTDYIHCIHSGHTLYVQYQ